MGRKNKQQDQKIETAPQRYIWKTVATYDHHDFALEDKNRRERDGNKLVKIKHRGDRFEVRIGSPVKKTEVPVEPPEAETPLDS